MMRLRTSVFCDNPLVCGNPNIRFYAGYPLEAPDGSRVGTLCVIDDKPREVSRDQLQTLRELGRMVEEEFVAADSSTVDPVSGISNRNGFQEIGNHLLSMCRRCEQPPRSWCITWKTCRLSRTNWAERKATRPVVEFAHLLMANFRNSDIVARLCMDIFGVLLAGTDLDGVEAAQHRLNEQLGARNREGHAKYDLEFDAHAVAFKEGRHGDAEALLHDGEVRILDAIQSREADVIANAG